MQPGSDSQICVFWTNALAVQHHTPIVSRVCILFLISLLAQGVNFWGGNYEAICLTCLFSLLYNLLKFESLEIFVKANTVIDWFYNMQCIIFLHKYWFLYQFVFSFFFYLYCEFVFKTSFFWLVLCLSLQKLAVLNWFLICCMHVKILLKTQWAVLEKKV